MGYSRFSRKYIHGEEPTVATAGINLAYYPSSTMGPENSAMGPKSSTTGPKYSATWVNGGGGPSTGYPGPGGGTVTLPGEGDGDGGPGTLPPGLTGPGGHPEPPWRQAEREAAMERYYAQINDDDGIAYQMINNQYLNGPVDANGNPTQGYAGQMGDIGNQYGNIHGAGGATPTGLQALIAQQQGINSGTDDPKFAAYQTAQNDLLDTQRQNANTQSSDFFARRGLGGSSAMRNEQMRIGSGYDQQQAALSGNIGLQQLQRRDQAALNTANLYGQQAGLLGQQAGVVQGAAGLYGTGLDYAGAGVESLLGPETIDISRLAAERAGG